MRSSHLNLAPALLLTLVGGVCLSGALAAAVRAQEAQPQTAAAAPSTMVAAKADDHATPEDTTRAIALYKQGHHQQAAEILRGAVKQRKTDAQAWLHLGIALTRAGKSKDARKAFERAAKLSPTTPQPQIGLAYIYADEGKLKEAERAAQRATTLDPRNAEARFALALVRMHQKAHAQALAETDAALQLNPSLGAAWLLKKEAALELYASVDAERMERSLKTNQPPPEMSPEERARLAGLLKSAADSIEQFLKLFPADRNATELREEFETVKFYAERAEKTDTPLVFKGSEVTTKAQIVSKPEPLYTEEARQKGISGTVRLRMMLSFDGRVRYILVVKSLKGGLTEMAVKAARRIKFNPAVKDGRRVSQFVTIEYNFNIY